MSNLPHAGIGPGGLVGPPLGPVVGRGGREPGSTPEKQDATHGRGARLEWGGVGWFLL